MKTFILTMVLFIASTNATSVPAIDITSIIEDCGSTGAKIDRLFLEGQCDVSNPLGCIARKGTSIKGSLSFTATAPTNSLQCSIFGQMPGFPTEMPFPGGCPVPNACDSMLWSHCPIEAGKMYTYGLSMDIGYTFPRKFLSWLIFSNNVWPVMMVETRFNTSKMHVMRYEKISITKISHCKI